MRRPLLLLLATLALARAAHAGPPAATHWARDTTIARRTDSLLALDPTREFTLALAREDYRFVGLRGASTNVPGVDFRDVFYPHVPADVRVIEGTTDHGTSGEVGLLNDVAAQYARRFNRLMLDYIRRRGGRPRPES